MRNEAKIAALARFGCNIIGLCIGLCSVPLICIRCSQLEVVNQLFVKAPVKVNVWPVVLLMVSVMVQMNGKRQIDSGMITSWP